MRDNVTLDSLFDSTNVTEYTHEDFEDVILDGRDYVHCKRCGADVDSALDEELCKGCVLELRNEYLEYLDEFHSSEKD